MKRQRTLYIALLILLPLAFAERASAQDIEAMVAGSGNANGFTVLNNRSDTLLTTRGNGRTSIPGLLTIGSSDPEFELTITGGIIARGTLDAGKALQTSGEGARMLWYPRKAAFRAGYVKSSHWDETNIGKYSFATGESVTAKGEASVALGKNTSAGGDQALASGSGCVASGNRASAHGHQSQAGGTGSTAFGYYGKASGDYSFAAGMNSESSGSHSCAIGGSATASASGAVALGENVEAAGSGAVSLGISTYSTEWGSTAMGYQSRATGLNATAIGFSAQASGSNATAIGRSTKANGSYSIAMGDSTLASKAGSTAIGSFSESTAPFAIAIGKEVSASGTYAMAFGRQSVASGESGIALGMQTTASGKRSIALGSYVSSNGNEGVLTLGDNSTTTVHSSGWSNCLDARFANGYFLYTNSGCSIGARLTANASSWSSISDSTRKIRFTSADDEAVLRRFSTLRLGSWNYRDDPDPAHRHYGPMAQEWYAAFGHDDIGTIGNDTMLSSADVDGVLCIAVKALARRTRENADRLRALYSRIEDLEALLTAREEELHAAKAEVRALRTAESRAQK